MKTFKYFIATACVVLLGACQDKGEWDAPGNTTGSYGNPNITETNLMTIKAFKTKYKDYIDNEGKALYIDEDIQIKGYITCNDVSGNMYKQIAIQDATGGILIGVDHGGLSGYLTEGQEILVDVKGLYIGNYRNAASVGIAYLDSDLRTCVGRMPESLWNKHFKKTDNKKTRAQMNEMITLFADCSNYDGKNFITTTWTWEDAGKLATLKNVSIKEGGFYNSDTETYMAADKYEECKFVPGVSKYVITYEGTTWSTSWLFNEMENNTLGTKTADKAAVQLYTSSYANFAANLLPVGKMNITGVVIRYRGQWEFIVRDITDVEDLSK